MIETIVEHFRECGFSVRVMPPLAFDDDASYMRHMPRTLIVSKEYQGEWCNIYWTIPRQDLRQRWLAYLLDMADRYMALIDKAIAERQEVSV